MAINVIQLNREEHSDFFLQNRIDPITREPFIENDQIVICASCKCAFLADTWNNIGSTHCGQTNTLLAIPRNEFAGLFSPPTILDFTVTPMVIYEGTPIKFRWSVQNARGCEIDNNIGNVPISGQIEIMPVGTQEKIYTLTAFTNLRRIRKQVKIRIVPIPTIQRILIPSDSGLHIDIPKLSSINIPKINIPSVNLKTTFDNYPKTYLIKPKQQLTKINLPKMLNFGINLEQIAAFVKNTVFNTFNN